MATISVSLPSDGQTVDAADVNTPINTIVSEFNGNIDNDNIKSGANISGTKLANNSIPPIAGDANMRGGWNTGILPTPNTVTYNGNRSYDLVFNSTDLTGYISPGMRLRATRTVSAPTQCTDLESSSSQYWSKSSPSGITFTDDFTVTAWVKLESYTAGFIISRLAATQGFYCYLDTTGQIIIGGRSASADRSGTSAPSVPLGKWVHLAATLDMSGNASTIYFDGVSVPVTMSGAATSLVQNASDLVIGKDGSAASGYFDGKMAQVGLFNAVLSQATIRSYYSQGLAGNETNCIGLWTFNGNGNDSNANANNLTANGSATATNSDSPFALSASGVPTGTTDFGIAQAVTFSTNTTLTVQVPEGNTIPTSGGISALAYSVHKVPYGFVAGQDKWSVETQDMVDRTQSSPVSGTWYNPGSISLSVPIGAWAIYWSAIQYSSKAAATSTRNFAGLATANNAAPYTNTLKASLYVNGASGSQDLRGTATRQDTLSLTVSATYYLNTMSNNTDAAIGFLGAEATSVIKATNAYL